MNGAFYLKIESCRSTAFYDDVCTIYFILFQLKYFNSLELLMVNTNHSTIFWGDFNLFNE